jgi:hypothetical protein
LAPTHAARAATLIYGYERIANRLVSFYSDAPASLVDDVAITGPVGGEVAGLDFRPATGELYAVLVMGAMSQAVTIDTATGVMTPHGAMLATPYGSFFGFDFDPVADRIRFVGDYDVNQRLDPDSGALLTDLPLRYAPGDVAEGSNPNVVNIAYTNSFVGAATTVLYGVDSGLDALIVAPSPNDGLLTTIGALGVDTTGDGGFDIQPGTNTTYAALSVAGVSKLYGIDLTTGVATEIGTIGGGTFMAGGAPPFIIAGIAIAPEAGAFASALCAGALLGFLRGRTQR